jgi:outer membrane lipoprotein-sorting protein
MMKLLKIFLLFIFPSLLITQTQEPELLNELQAKYDSINDVSANFIQKTNNMINISGKLYFKKENNVRCDLGNILIVSNGKTNWNYNKKQDKVVISNYDSTDPSVFSLGNIILNFPGKCEVTDLSTADSKVLQLVPKDNSVLHFKKAKIYMTEDNLVEKLLIWNSNDDLIEIDLSDYELNPSLPDSYFNFVPPKGSKIVDLR